MASNVQFQSSVPATPSSATLVQTVQQPDTSQRQVISVGDFWGSSAGNLPVQLSSNPTVIPSSIVSVAITGTPTVTLSSNPTVIPSSAVQVTLTSNVVALSSAPPFALSSAISVSSGTFTLSSNPTVIPSSVYTVTLSSNPTVIPSSAVQVTLTSNVVAVSSGTVTLSSNPTVILSSVATVTLSSNPTVIPSSIFSVMGDVANAVVDSGNPIKIGGIYNSTNPTSVTSGQRVNAWFDKSGKQIVNSALRALKGVQLTAISCSATETNITPSSSGGNFIDIYGLVLSNLSTTSAQQVTIKDSSGGTSRMIFEVPALDTRGFMVPVDGAMVQSGTSQAWTATLGGSSGPFQITALYVTNI